jgi:arabinose-5-phosphate isomerase
LEVYPWKQRLDKTLDISPEKQKKIIKIAPKRLTCYYLFLLFIGFIMDFCRSALTVIEIEAQAIFELSQRIDENFEKACRLLLGCRGRVVTTGMGKSGHIANKIAATLSSTGTPAFFLHPGEASHGDFGMRTRGDTVIAISYSGSTPEVVTLLPYLKRLEISLISLTGNAESELAKASDVHLDVHVRQEACPLGLAPTTSTTVSLVMGDALSIALLTAKGFRAEDFALSHPGGTLGRRLLLHIDELYHGGDALPLVNENTSVSEALMEVTEKKLGMTCIVDAQGYLTGIFTDGDIRRFLHKNLDIHTTPLKLVMSAHSKTIKKGMLAAEALTIMQKNSITSLIVIDDANKPLGVLHLHDLLKAGVL